jgi:hypothetical protein
MASLEDLVSRMKTVIAIWKTELAELERAGFGDTVGPVVRQWIADGEKALAGIRP